MSRISIFQNGVIAMLSILIFGTIFIAPNIFISRYYTYQALWGIGGLTSIVMLLLILNKTIYITRFSLLSMVFSLLCLIAYHQKSLFDISGVFLLITGFAIIIGSLYWDRVYSVFYKMLVGIAALEALYGLAQFFNLLPKYGTFPITGTFDNPAGFAICLSILFPFVLFKDRSLSWNKWVWKGVVAVLCFTTVILSQSRAGIITIILVTILWLWEETNAAGAFKRWNKLIMILFITVVLSIVSAFLYLYKLDSANGRLLIWNVTFDLIKEAPFWGSGSGAFVAKYMVCQADYFLRHQDSSFILLADNVKHPFNEYLLFIVEYGMCGIAMCFAFALFIRYIYMSSYNNSKKPAIYSLVCTLIIGLFSYPLNYPFVWIIIGISLAIVTYEKNYAIKLHPIFKVMIFIFSFYIIIVPIRQRWRDERVWFKIANRSLSGDTTRVITQYSALHRNLKDGYFLYNYGAELAFLKKHDQSNVILKECTNYLNDADVQLLMADNHIQLQEYEKAEECLELAKNMCPNRFMPLYKLMTIHITNNNEKKAQDIAKIISSKQIKVPSPTVMMIKREASKVLGRR